MKTVRIIKNWTGQWMSDERLLAQTPHSSGTWNGIRFLLHAVPSADYVVVLNRPRRTTTVRVRPTRVWGVIQEPPNELYAPMHRGQRAFARTLTSREDLKGTRYMLSHPAIPWFVEKSHDELSSLGPSPKLDSVCCLTSMNVQFRGHVDRLRMLRQLRIQMPIEVYGRGIRPIGGKWELLSRYKYSLVMENYIGGWYWTEKLIDCFLSWTVPFYVGCPRIGEYFPEGSYLLLNGKSTAEIRGQMLDAIAGDYWQKNLDALATARDRVLNRYGMFPYLARLVDEHENTGADAGCSERDITIWSISPHLIDAWARAKARAIYVNTRDALRVPVVSTTFETTH